MQLVLLSALLSDMYALPFVASLVAGSAVCEAGIAVVAVGKLRA